MNNDKLSLLLGTCIVPGIIESLAVPEDRQADLVDQLYGSKLYVLLSDDASSMWHLSPVLLGQLFKEELATGTFDVPEEQS
jgi:hypothetical protein